MSDGALTRLSRALSGSAILLAVAAVISVGAVGRWTYVVEHLAGGGIAVIGFGGLSWIMQPVQPRNRAIWAFTVSAFITAVILVGIVLPIHVASLPEDAGALRAQGLSDVPLAAAVVLWLRRWLWIPAWLVTGTFGVLHFPDGRLPGRRWRVVVWLSAALIVVTVLQVAVPGFPASGTTISPPGFAFEPVDVSVVGPGILLSTLCSGSLVIRYRRSGAQVRSQIRTIAVGNLVVWIVFMAALGIHLSVGEDPAASGGRTLVAAVLTNLAFIALFGAFAVAILRFNLYGIDVIVSKSIVFLTLAGFIAAAYVGAVIVVGRLIGGLSFVSSILAVVFASVAFQPIRQVVHRAANRLVYGQRLAPYDVLAAFAERAVDLDDDELIGRLPQLVVDGTSASEATVWSRAGDGFEAVASLSEGPDSGFVSGERPFNDGAASWSTPIVHEQEVVGELSIVVARGESLGRADETLLNDLAAGLGVALRNTKLVSQLRRSVAVLEDSRQRVMTAGTTARRELEADLDRATQPQLEVLRSGLDRAVARARTSGSPQLAEMLAPLQHDLAETESTIRDLAQGIFPRTLEADGLIAAIEEHAGVATIPVEVRGHDVQRYGRLVEAAVYFAVLEALQNTLKHAEAALVKVTLCHSADDQLSFEVSDDGQGFDPASIAPGAGLNGIADRVDTDGGPVAVTSTPGTGTTVVGSVPLDRTADRLAAERAQPDRPTADALAVDGAR